MTTYVANRKLKWNGQTYFPGQPIPDFNARSKPSLLSLDWVVPSSEFGAVSSANIGKSVTSTPVPQELSESQVRALSYPELVDLAKSKGVEDAHRQKKELLVAKILGLEPEEEEEEDEDVVEEDEEDTEE